MSTVAELDAVTVLSNLAYGVKSVMSSSGIAATRCVPVPTSVKFSADWKNFEDAAKKPKPKTLEEWTAEVDKRLRALEKSSIDDKK